MPDIHHTVDLTEVVLFDSKTLFKEMALLRPNAIQKAQKGFQWMHDNFIDGVLIGGMATAHWGQDRALTPDMDVMVDDVNNIKTMLHFQNIPFQPLAGIKGRYEGIHVPSLDIDFIDATKGNVQLNQHIMKTASLQRIGGVSFKVADPHVLSISKFWSARNKDLDDGFNLLKSGNIKQDTLKTHLQTLRPSLKNSDTSAQDIWGYAKHLIPK